MDSLEIARILNGYNPWWTGKPIGDIPNTYRRDYFHLSTLIESPDYRAIVISGPRQVGKTTLVQQLVRSTLKLQNERGELVYEPKRVMYATPELIASSQPESKIDTLSALFNSYEELIIEEKLTRLSKKTILFIDEVQTVKNWAGIVKPYLDASPKQLKIVITGSSRLSLMEGSSEKLPGRHLSYILLPLKFIDRLRFNNKDFDEVRDFFGPEGFRSTLLKGITSGNVRSVYSHAAKIFLRLEESSKLKIIQSELSKQLISGGYPEIVLKDDVNFQYQRFSTYVSDIVSKDMEHSRKPELAQRLLVNLAKSNTQQLTESELRANTYGDGQGNPSTIQKYLDDLEQLAIVRRLYRNKSNKNQKQRKPKIYFCDSGLRNSMIGYLGTEVSDEELGLLAETVTFDHLLRFMFKLQGHIRNVYFHKINDQGKEVDFVVRGPRDNLILGVEVKYRNSHAEEVDGLRDLKENNPKMFSLVLTKNLLKNENNKILYLPLWMFLACA